MRTMDSIKVVVYLREDRDNPIVRRFLGLGGREYLEMEEESGLDAAVESLRKRGIGSKEAVILKRFRGRMFQKCPGSPGMICCNYLLMNIGFNCLYDCTYCFLNYYLNSFGIVQFINPGISLSEIEDAGGGSSVLRVGTGEYTDSLMLDEVTGISASLIAEAARHPNIFLEFKTKSDNISHLLGIGNKGNAVLSWTLNTPGNIALYEAGTASLGERIRAAAEACRAGFLTGFHFDPLIYSDGWIDEYLDVVALLFSAVDPERVAWISMGCFRYSPGFREIIREVFPGNRLAAEEMFPGPDGKYRYIKKTRVAVYRALLDRIRRHAVTPFVYLCMETDSIWRDVFGVDYRTSDDLEKSFCAHLAGHYIR